MAFKNCDMELVFFSDLFFIHGFYLLKRTKRYVFQVHTQDTRERPIKFFCCLFHQLSPTSITFQKLVLLIATSFSLNRKISTILQLRFHRARSLVVAYELSGQRIALGNQRRALCSNRQTNVNVIKRVKVVERN